MFSAQFLRVFRFVACAVIAGMILATVAEACNIPVFRYALERWQADRSEVIVLSRGPLSASEQAMVDALRQDSVDAGGHANASVRQVDLNIAEEEDQSLWKSLSTQPATNQVNSAKEISLPHVVVRASIAKGRTIHAWHGPLAATRQVGILRSAARDELADRLLAGQSIVWLVIRSSDASRNETVSKLLSDTFQTLATKIQLPEGIGLPGSELFSEIPLLVRFSALEVDRDDPREELLVKMLAGLQPVAYADDEPLIVPVFGRGRALEVIPARDLDGKLIEDLTLFLSGACSCQVKERNPGFDLLLAADWKTELFGEADEPPIAETPSVRSNPVLLNIPPGRRP